MSKSGQKVTVGIPVYNEVDFIERTLCSVVGQADEILISDNASTDGTSEICRRYAENYPEIRYIRHDENKGSQFNFGYVLENAKHEYFMWLGGHDLLPRNHIQKLRNILDAEDVVLAYANAAHLTDEYVLKGFYAYDYAEELLSDNPAERVLSIILKLGDCTLFHGIYKKDILIKSIHDASDEKYHGIDHGIIGEVAYNGKMKLCDDTVYYRISPRFVENDPIVRWKRVLRTIYSSQYNEAIHIPELIPIGISFVQLRTAEKAAPRGENRDEYINHVKTALSMRWGYNNLVNKYLERVLHIRNIRLNHQA